MRCKVEILCPNWRHTLATVERVAAELGIDDEISPVRVPDPDAAQRLRFLGSPTVRVDGRDIEPGAAGRTDYALACCVYRTSGGPGGEPEERWLREALQTGG